MIAGAASVTLGYLFPRDADAFTRQAEEIASSRLWAGVHFRTDNDVGLALGRSVGHVVVELACRDGSR